MWDVGAQALDFRVILLVLTTCLTSLAFQSLTNWVGRAFRTTDQFAKHFYRDLDGESKFQDVQATIRWKQRVMRSHNGIDSYGSERKPVLILCKNR